MPTLGELTPEELLKSAANECSGLSAALERLGDTLPEYDRRLLGAYVGSIWSRLSVALLHEHLVGLSDEAYRMVCGLVQPTWDVEPETVVGEAWDEVRARFPLSYYQANTKEDE